MSGGMKTLGIVFLVVACLLLISPAGYADERPLAKPALKGEVSLEEALAKRRSVRKFDDEPLDVRQIAQLLWAAQGITGKRSKRTSPSAGALYPLTIYLVVGKVKGLPPGVYRYKPVKHALVKVKGADHRAKLARAAGGQRWVSEAPVSFVIAVNYGRMDLYHARGKMYADMEMGHAAQNILLQATALGLGAVPVGAVRAATASKVLDLPAELIAEYVIPVGKPD
jgi:SagB-type dehydrogenase family enzyme